MAVTLRFLWTFRPFFAAVEALVKEPVDPVHLNLSVVCGDFDADIQIGRWLASTSQNSGSLELIIR